jgi:hypothetical protein
MTGIEHKSMKRIKQTDVSLWPNEWNTQTHTATHTKEVNRTNLATIQYTSLVERFRLERLQLVAYSLPMYPTVHWPNHRSLVQNCHVSSRYGTQRHQSTNRRSWQPIITLTWQPSLHTPAPPHEAHLDIITTWLLPFYLALCCITH